MRLAGPIGPIARLQRFLIMGTSPWEVEAAHMVLLDAGLAASFDSRLQSHVGSLFTSIVKFQGTEFGNSILNMSPTQPLVKKPDDFVAEVTAKMDTMRIALSTGNGRAGENIRNSTPAHTPSRSHTNHFSFRLWESNDQQP